LSRGEKFEYQQSIGDNDNNISKLQQQWLEAMPALSKSAMSCQ